MAKVICQNCGAEVVLPEHSTMCMGMNISEETKGTFVIPTKENTGDKTMVNETGMDAATLEVIKNAMGEEAYKALTEKIGLDNPLVQNIVDNGDLECGVDFHRWVLKQMTEYLFSWEKNWTKMFKMHVDYMGQFTDYLNKLKKINSLAKNGKHKAVAEEMQFISKEDVINLCEEYLDILKTQIAVKDTKPCKKVPYYEFNRKDFFGSFTGEKYGNMVFVEDVERKIYKPLETAINSIRSSDTPRELYHSLLMFTKQKFFLNVKHSHNKAFINNFKGYGAYFALKDSIRFFGVRCTDYSTGNRILDRDASLVYLEKCKDYSLAHKENYTLLALLEKSWKDSGFDIDSYKNTVIERKRSR